MKRRKMIKLAKLKGIGAPLLMSSWTTLKHKRIETVRLACIDVGGMRWGNIKLLQGEKFVALCYLDSASIKKAKELYPEAKHTAILESYSEK